MFRLEVWGPFACFTHPEFNTERYSYDLITPSAARGICEAIYWHPGVRYCIDKIYVCSPIRRMTVMRNEISTVISARNVRTAFEGRRSPESLSIYSSDFITQRRTSLLCDVRYVIEGHIECISSKMNKSDSASKFVSIFNRRIEKGQFAYSPSFGLREFPCFFRKFTDEKVPTVYSHEHEDKGFILEGIEYGVTCNCPRYIRAVLDKGCLDVANAEVHV